MFYSRKLNHQTGNIEIWECEWDNKSPGMTYKRFTRFVGIEEEGVEVKEPNYCAAEAVCWAPGNTIGNIAVSSDAVFGVFTQKEGTDAILPCHIVKCGKFRNGAPRWYCKTHQTHWGINADRAAISLTENGDVVCGNHGMRMSYVVNPLTVDFTDFEEIGIWCSLPAAISTKQITRRAPRIHVHKRMRGLAHKVIDTDFNAIVCTYNQSLGLFNNSEITKIQVTPPAAFEFVRSLELGETISCVSCKRCGYPHLDLGSFARRPHAKHFCGNCGNDSIWSSEPIVSNPLKPLHDQFNNSNIYISPVRSLDLDEHLSLGHEFDVWASTPAVVWTANRPQEKGIHVHVYNSARTEILIDETFGAVTLNNRELSRDALWNTMIYNTIY